MNSCKSVFVCPFFSCALLVFLASFLTACGGGSSSEGTGTVRTDSPASGEYLWEVGVAPNLSYSAINATTGALGPVTVANSTAGNDSAYPSIAIPPSGTFLYSFFSGGSELLTYQMSGPGLVLKRQLGATHTQELPLENSLTMHPSGKFLYVIQSGALGVIQEISLNAGTGAMTLGPTVKESADLRVGYIDSQGRFLFVSDLSGGRVYVYQINQQSGALSPVANSPFTLPSGKLPTYLAIGGSADSQFLYAALYSSKGMAAFAINSTTGALVIVPGSPFLTKSTADYVCADPSGKFLYSSDSETGSINGQVIDPTTGVLSPIPGSPFFAAPPTGTIAIDQSGKFVYVTNFTNSTIYGFSLDSTTGALTALTGSPFPSVLQPFGLTMMKIQ